MVSFAAYCFLMPNFRSSLEGPCFWQSLLSRIVCSGCVRLRRHAGGRCVIGLCNAVLCFGTPCWRLTRLLLLLPGLPPLLLLHMYTNSPVMQNA